MLTFTPSQAPIAVDAQRFDYVSRVDGFADWGYAVPGSKDVWIVCLHGHRSNGDQLFVRPDLRDTWLPAFRATGAGILTLNLRNNNWMGPKAVADMRDVLAAIRTRFHARHFVLFSGSMAGTGNLIYSMLHPDDIAAVCALCPATDLTRYHAWCGTSQLPVVQEIRDAITAAYGGTPAEAKAVYAAHSAFENAKLLTMPVFICHGTNDQLIPVEESRRLVEILGARAIYEEMEGGHHDSPLASKQAMEWLNQQVDRLS